MEVQVGGAVAVQLVIVDTGAPLRQDAVAVFVELVSVVVTAGVRVFVGMNGLAAVPHGNRIAIVVHRVGAVFIQIVTQTVPDNMRAFTLIQKVRQAAQYFQKIRRKLRQVFQADQGRQYAFYFAVGQFFQVRWWQVVTGVFHHIVMDVKPLGIGVDFFIGGVVLAINQLIADVDHRRGAVIFEGVVKDFDVVVTQGNKTCATGHH